MSEEDYRGFALTNVEELEQQAEENSDLIDQLIEGKGSGIHPIVAPNTDHEASGAKCTLTAGENLVFGEVCYFKSDGKCWKADSSATSTLPVFVMALATISADASGEFLLLGFVRDDSWAWTVGGKIYISSTAGSLTQTVPAGEEVVTVGIATHADRMFFNPNYVNVSDVTYNATSWNANYDPATKNVIRDKFEALSSLQIDTGTYSGDGTADWSNAISCGFRPKRVVAYEDLSSDNDNIKFSVIDESNAATYAIVEGSNTQSKDNRLRIAANGFEVNDDGGDNPPNKNARTYVYFAIG